jgi:hypothetical protein
MKEYLYAQIEHNELFLINLDMRCAFGGRPPLSVHILIIS